jgi:hypothetical protein
MLAPFIKRDRGSAPKRIRERGVTMALVAISMVAIISFAALAIDLGSLYEAKAEAQRSADAAALTAAQVISLSGITGDPSNSDSNWASICGTSGTATLAAQAVANQDLVAGKAPTTVTVLYGAGGTTPSQTDCTSVSSNFGINPTVSVYVQQASLPTFFARVFSLIGGISSISSVSATAYAEAFNPSDSNNGAPTPVQPRCVKPIVVPNEDPRHPISGCSGNSCSKFVNPSTGQIMSQGMYSTNPNGVIGERFFLVPDCTPRQSTCTLPNGQPTASPPNLYYVPGAASAVTPVAIPTTEATCANLNSSWSQDVAGCDQSTVYQCGVPVTQSSNSVNLSENPATNDAQNAIQCLINQSASTTTAVSGQDTLGTYNPGVPPTYPFQILAGSSNPLVVSGGLTSGNQITDSSSIVSLPIYDQTTATLTKSGVTTVSIIGFLQVFINGTNSSNNAVDVTVLNVTGCGNTASTTAPADYGTSPVPVRLISPP